MEDVLDLYQEVATAPDPARPVVCVDERPMVLHADAHPPQPAVPGPDGHPRRIDYEYVRQGGANCFLCFAPGEAWRHVEVTAQRTNADFARLMRWLVEERYPDAPVVRVVLDNLSTHTPAALYQTFAPEDARRLAQRLEFHYTPKHASWLNMAELELAVLARQCLARRLATQADVARECAAWEAARNAAGVGVTWRFTTRDARTTLARLYPQIA